MNHWRNFSGTNDPTYCSANGCINKNPIGGHVKKVNGADNNHYIVPICDSHNRLGSDKEFTIHDLYLVSANISETCGKK